MSNIWYTENELMKANAEEFQEHKGRYCPEIKGPSECQICAYMTIVGETAIGIKLYVCGANKIYSAGAK